MIIRITLPGQAAYDRVRRFAYNRYKNRLGAAVCVTPEAFSYACTQHTIVGCFGIYRADVRSTVLLERYIPDVFRHISGRCDVDRRLCAEIGTRAAIRVQGFRSADVALALAARLLVHGHEQGLRYFCFTGNRTVRTLAKHLGIELIRLGTPDLSRTDAAFRRNWDRFFRIRQECFGFELRSPATCIAACERLEANGIRTDMSR